MRKPRNDRSIAGVHACRYYLHCGARFARAGRHLQDGPRPRALQHLRAFRVNEVLVVQELPERAVDGHRVCIRGRFYAHHPRHGLCRHGLEAGIHLSEFHERSDELFGRSPNELLHVLGKSGPRLGGADHHSLEPREAWGGQEHQQLPAHSAVKQEV